MFHNGFSDCPLNSDLKPAPFILGFTPLHQQLVRPLNAYWLLPHPRLSRYHWQQQDRLLLWGGDADSSEIFAFQWITQLLPTAGIVSQGILVSLSSELLFLGIFAARTLQIPCWVILDRTPEAEQHELEWVLNHPHPRAPVTFILQGLPQAFKRMNPLLPPANAQDWQTLLSSPQKK